MAYRRTPKVEAHLARTRERIVSAAMQVVAQEGYRGASMPVIAKTANVSTGLLYRYFPSKAALFQEVFHRTATREVEACRVAASNTANARDRLRRVVSTFARRALRNRRLAWALLVEPVHPQIEAARLAFREQYRNLFAEILGAARMKGEIPDQSVEVVAAAMVGAIAESLIGPLAAVSPPDNPDDVVMTLVHFCMRAAGFADGDDCIRYAGSEHQQASGGNAMDEEDMLQVGQQILAGQSFSRLLGSRLTAFRPGEAVLEIPLNENLLQQHGFVHGGVLSYAADNTLTFVGGSVLGPNVLTSEFKINYVRPATGKSSSPAPASFTRESARRCAAAMCMRWARKERFCAPQLRGQL
ncbi:hypothetical protein GCM10025857_01890 [Alicyclobacillus contaminans]|nr:hypothetical protein GCM10025857_01890 [Alicyclobacillus contaminans]